MQQRSFLGMHRRRNLYISVGVGIAFLGVIVMILLLRPSNEATIRLGSGTFQAQLAMTDEARAKGLGGVEHLGDGEAMLFAHDASRINTIWMKDMKIPIDAVWLDDDRVVVHVEQSLQPSSYPQTYGPDIPTRYVLEVADGMTAKASIRVGMQATIVLPDGKAQ